MFGLINTLINILSLEQKRGYSNASVMGGFGRFTGFIETNAQDDVLQPEDVSLLVDVFKQYDGLSMAERQGIVKELLTWLRSDPANNRLSIALTHTPHEKTQRQEQREYISQDQALFGKLQSIRGIGEKNSRFFNKLGIFTIYDLLRFFPRRYQDFSQLKTINRLEYGDELSVIGTLKNDLYTRNAKSRKMKIIEGVLTDSTGSIKLTWFNQPYLTTQLGKGTAIVVSGKVDMYLGRLVMNSPDWEPLDSEQLHTNRIVPIYPLTAGLSQRIIRKIIYRNLPFWSARVKEYLPEEILQKEEYPSIADALKHIHFPDDDRQLDQIRRRFAFEEIFFLQLGVLAQKSEWSDQTARRYALQEKAVLASESRLPYHLTNDQKSAIQEILKDLSSGHPMNRLLQGDVGSGKTVVAKFAIQAILAGGVQAAVMAPTSILAEQHYRTLSDLLVSDGLLREDEIALLIGATHQKERPDILERLADGRIKVIVGTHALLEDPVTFKDLQLAVIDEQHRFGVEQRTRLHEKGDNPHLLVMTATPIPRSLALTVYGDLDVTTITEMPAGRQPVETRVLHPHQRQEAYDLIREQIAAGFQAFVVYPLVENDEEDQEAYYRAAVNEKERLAKEVFPDLKVGLMHGKLKPSEKEKVMLEFRKGKYQILVSTTVIEVGVDIPRATVVLIEGANRFGLAQLHQIRGRVGRNMDQSYCLLIPEDESKLENERLMVMATTNDGFRLAEFDLEQRGPGEFLGTRQSGYAGLRFASITDTHLIEKCRNYAKTIFEQDPALKQTEHQLLSEQLKYCWPGIQFNLNN